ncbi:MAG: Zn-ribbon domain-containing OB-fold protein [Acidimicrobiia bacterium]
MPITRAEFPLPDVDDPLTAGYFSAAARAELAIPRCGACGRWVWYPEAACPDCGGALAWTATSGRGTLFTWVVVERAFLPAFAEMVPFVTALVALEEDPAVRIVALVVDAEPASLRAGLAMEVDFRPLRFPTVPNHEVLVPMFRPAVPR